MDRQLVREIHVDLISLWTTCSAPASRSRLPERILSWAPVWILPWFLTNNWGLGPRHKPMVSHSCWYVCRPIHIYIYIYLHTYLYICIWMNFRIYLGRLIGGSPLQFWAFFEVGRCSKPCMDTQRKRSMLCSRLSMLFWAECGQGATTLQGSHRRCTEICTYIVICRHTYGSTQKNWSVDVPPLEDS